VLLGTIRRKMASNPLKIRVDFALTCTSFEGIDVIKEALLTAKHAVNDENWNLDFNLIAPPNYKCEVVTHQRAEGEKKLLQALQIIQEVMKAKKGKFKQKSEPTVIGAKSDEPDLTDLIDNLRSKTKGEESLDEEEEDNQEGMGDVDLSEQVADDDDGSGDDN